MNTKEGRRLFSIAEIYSIVYNGTRSAPHMGKARRNKELGPDLIERIMLAVTEVNGCEICSYAHAKMALEAGMSGEEISSMLSGDIAGVPANDSHAVMFAQHYADSRGHPTGEAWARIEEFYGPVKAYGILGAVRIIMMGNAYGIPWSSFFNRLKGRPDKRSSLLYEAGVITVGSLLILPAMVHAAAAAIFGREIIKSCKPL